MLKTAIAGTGLFLLGIPLFIAMAATSAPAPSTALTPTDEAIADIPPDYLALYRQYARPPGLTWAVLAAVGDIESDHGRNPKDCAPNSAGAIGPMQFLPSTWKGYAVDGDHDGDTDICDPEDAIPTAATYLAANGATKGGRHLERALWHYNHADWYVRKVLDRAAEYAKTATTPGATAAKAALRWIGTPYSWGGGNATGPTYGIEHGAGTRGFDCSGLALHAWAQAGVALPRVAADQFHAGQHIPRTALQPGDLVFFATNPKDPSTIHHVGIHLGEGRMVHAPQTGSPVQISRWAGDPSRESEYAGATRPTPR
ncbi:transglycosylase protein with SLT domain [Actinocorallia herbida]|uniref:Transglycosylase protein with SLT domain n=1 Tax=Actinocorallia herbida TaxID=58109 RepID=A0A3N1D3K1_9ACTN|nr:transglycosylase protein with SLT domain [Actinocorallia herbida]